ncbi:hypothetical protein CMI38_04720 [Candidatus Pacearchaeota archaeon]|jgi:hypothetical protein|nr:hypothetical protein [Candidatus Pacearchaeota archaeon]|tara:strand:+ start:204 stop:1004 length:801 start_codon:yes stop_codon:yes gene_type:complete
MKKCLVLGCSHSAGSYVSYSDKAEFPETIDTVKGYYSFIDIPDIEYTVYAVSNGGYLNFAKIIANMLSSDIFQPGEIGNFDFVLIQETFEPRILMTNNNPEWKLNDKVENLKHHHLLPHEEVINFAHRPESKEEVKVDQTFIWDRHNVEYKNNKKLMDWWIQVVKDNSAKGYLWLITKSAITYINHVLQRLNIPCYILSWHQGTNFIAKPFHTWCRYLNLPLLERVIYKNLDFYVYHEDKNYIGHATINGNKEIGKLLTKELKEVL